MAPRDDSPQDDVSLVETPTAHIAAPDETPTEHITAPPPPAPQGSARLPRPRMLQGALTRARGAVASVFAHPRIAGGTVAGLLLITLLVPLLSAFGSPHTAPRTTAHATPTPSPTATLGATPSPTAQPPSDATLTWVTHLRSLAEQAYVDNMISHMSLDEEIGQMVMIGFNGTEIYPGLANLISQYHVGSVVLYAWNIQSADQTTKFIQDMQAQAKIPLLVATDQEGGGVNRLLSILGPLPSAAEVASRGSAFAKQRGEQDGRELAKLGINVDFAPVVDVLNTPGGAGDIGPRAFGSTPQVVTTMAGAYLQGLQEQHQVVGTLKHFPGLGDVPTDPHNQLYFLKRSLADLEAIDWAPYKALIATGQVDMIMSTHVVVDAVDPTLPASLSKPVLTGILRDQLGFNGVIITDGIYMKAVYQLGNFTSFAPIFLKAVEAGNDIICSTWDTSSTALFIQTIHDAVTNGTLSKQRIDDSVRRILLLKLRYGVLAGAHNG